MSWQNEMVRTLRYLIDDVTAVTYTDSRLEETIVISGHLTLNELNFDKEYVIDIDSCYITPDPTTAPRDIAFINLVCLKAACIVLKAEAKVKADCSVKVKDGPSEIDMGGSYKALKEMADQACTNYETAKIQYQAGNSRVGEAIIGPYTQDNIPTFKGNIG